MFRMKPKTEELLYHMFWLGDRFMRPTFRNLTDSFEAWAYRNGLTRQLAELARRQLLETKPGDAGETRVVRLTQAGRLHAIGGRDPDSRWDRAWDGRWRMVLFDLPVEQNAARDSLRFQLRKRGFGRLQKSVWISPDPLNEERALLDGCRVNVGSLLLLEARPCAGESDEEIVAGAWDFAKINQAYSDHAEVLAARPTGPISDETSACALRKWAEQERLAWRRAMEHDPLLPRRLLPKNYLGCKSWQERVKSFRKNAGQMHSFRSSAF